MPNMCYSYPADIPPDSANRDAGRAARRGIREMPFPCYSYPNSCFGYPPAVPPGGGNRGDAPPARTGPVQMPVNLCFRY